MMRKAAWTASALFCLSTFSISCFAYYGDTPRLYLWGLGGSTTIGRADALLPIYKGCNSLFYSDLQAKVGDDNAWLASGGLGYRGITGNNILGGYLFLDRNVSEHHNEFWVLSPGAEWINNCWDARINGYIPVSKRRKDGEPFFPSGENQCGIHADCSFVEFHGHQQFEHRFFDFEEIGPGIDAEIGMFIPNTCNFSIHGGGYFYQLKDEKDIRGVEGRVELPIKNNLALTVEASYDNVEHGAIVGGIRIQLGHAKDPCCYTLCDHLYDRVARNLGTVKTGSGIPVVEGRKDEGLFLRRDNIYFFTANDGSVFSFDSSTGTFENPLRADQFNNATLLAIEAQTGGGNFYFSTGRYSLGATSVTLLANQGIFGRTEDYRCTAVGNERPVLAFTETGIAPLLVTGGNNHIDSIILQNIVAGPTTVMGLDIENNPGVFICNSVIDAETTVVGDNTGTNAAIGIQANNSNVIIDPTLIKAVATVTNNNNLINAAVGIGNVSGSTVGNTITLINDVEILANAVVGNNNASGTALAFNFAMGIGTVVSGGEFLRNTFIIDDSAISAMTLVGGVNTDAAENATVGIGEAFAQFGVNKFTITNTDIVTDASVSALLDGQIDTVGVGSVLNTFNNNQFNINRSSIQATTTITNNNASDVATVGVGNSLGFFDANNIKITESAIKAEGLVGTVNANNRVTAVGDIIGTFTNNTLTIDRSSILSGAIIQTNNTNNLSVGIGGVSSVNLSNNIFTMNESAVNAHAVVTGNNDDTGAVNSARGVNGTNTIFNVDASHFIVEAIVAGNNIGTNEATGLFADSGATVNISNSVLDIFAIVGGAPGINIANDKAGAGVFNITNTQFNIVKQP